jgi:hypothetical protein
MKRVWSILMVLVVAQMSAMAGWYAVAAPDGAVVLQSGDTPYPVGAIESLPLGVAEHPDRFKVVGGSIVARSTEEIAEREAAIEAARQQAKPDALKDAENRLLNWFRTRVPGQATRTEFASALEAKALAGMVLQPMYDVAAALPVGSERTAALAAWSLEKSVVEACREGVVIQRQLVGMDGGEDAAVADATWHPEVAP